jgi:hypothetical protein
VKYQFVKFSHQIFNIEETVSMLSCHNLVRSFTEVIEKENQRNLETVQLPPFIFQITSFVKCKQILKGWKNARKLLYPYNLFVDDTNLFWMKFYPRRGNSQRLFALFLVARTQLLFLLVIIKVLTTRKLKDLYIYLHIKHLMRSPILPPS